MLTPRASQREMHAAGTPELYATRSTLSPMPTMSSTPPGLQSGTSFASAASMSTMPNIAVPSVTESENHPMLNDDRSCECRCCHDFSAEAPPIDPREMFVNIVIQEVQDNTDLVREVHNWWLGTIGQVLGGGQKQFASKIAHNYFTENLLAIKYGIKKICQKHGFYPDIDIMSLPPTRGSPNQSTYLQMTREPLPIFLVCRLRLKEVSEMVYRWPFRCHIRGHMTECMHEAGAGSLVPMIGKKDAEVMSTELEEKLGHYESKRDFRPIKAKVNFANASEEMHVLYNMHWSEREAARAIVQSRNKGASKRRHLVRACSVLIFMIAVMGVFLIMRPRFSGNSKTEMACSSFAIQRTCPSTFCTWTGSVCETRVCSNTTAGKSSTYPCKCGKTHAAAVTCTNGEVCTATNDDDGVCQTPVCSNVAADTSSTYPCKCGKTHAAEVTCTNGEVCTANTDDDGVCQATCTTSADCLSMHLGVFEYVCDSGLCKAFTLTEHSGQSCSGEGTTYQYASSNMSACNSINGRSAFSKSSCDNASAIFSFFNDAECATQPGLSISFSAKEYEHLRTNQCASADNGRSYITSGVSFQPCGSGSPKVKAERETESHE